MDGRDWDDKRLGGKGLHHCSALGSYEAWLIRTDLRWWMSLSLFPAFLSWEQAYKCTSVGGIGLVRDPSLSGVQETYWVSGSLFCTSGFFFKPFYLCIWTWWNMIYSFCKVALPQLWFNLMRRNKNKFIFPVQMQCRTSSESRACTHQNFSGNTQDVKLNKTTEDYIQYKEDYFALVWF